MKFRYMSFLIYQIFQKAGYGKYYKKVWNPLNYAIVAGIGVLINMVILLSLANALPLWIANLTAIFVAWTWNWSMSVGPLGYLWNFGNRGGEK